MVIRRIPNRIIHTYQVKSLIHQFMQTTIGHRGYVNTWSDSLNITISSINLQL